jgi:hypothetical protein
MNYGASRWWHCSSLRAYEIFVNNGVPNSDPNQQENEKEDIRALFYIQQVVHDIIFSKIAAATNAKEAWTTLKTTFQGSTRVMAIKL